MTPAELRNVLQQPASLEAIRAAAASGDLASIVPTRCLDHIADVYARLERIVTASPESWPLKLVVLVHEEPPARAAQLVARGGFPDIGDLVFHILHGFGAVWKVRSDAHLVAFPRSGVLIQGLSSGALVVGVLGITIALMTRRLVLVEKPPDSTLKTTGQPRSG